MTMEADLVAVLRTVCPRVHPLQAPLDTPRPYVTWQPIGGAAWRYQDNAAAVQRHTLVQVNVWTGAMTETLQLVRQIEAALCAATTFTARPEGEPITQYESDFKVYGAIQDFSVEAPR